MIDFLIVHRNHSKRPIAEKSIWLDDTWQLFLFGNRYEIKACRDEKIIVIGDSIDPITSFSEATDPEVCKKPGHFYAIIIRQGNVKVYNSFLSMMPIYYHQRALIISSSVSLIKQYVQESLTIDKKFILENLLFNYSFFNRSLYREISLLPIHTYIRLQRTMMELHTSIDIRCDLLNTGSKSKRYNADQLSDLFIKTTQKYFPDQSFQVAFTSGFDGRTLVSCATKNRRDFETYSVGRFENDDVRIPMENAEALDIPYRFFDLGDTAYLNTSYFKNALEYTNQGYLGNGFLYAHFLYSTKEIAKTTEYMFSGICGSELFRALHTSGAVTSQALVDLFTIKNEAKIKQMLLNARPLDVLNKSKFRGDLEELIDEVLQYKRKLPSALSSNQSFYVFVFEEVFRKFFGQWIYMQQKYIKVRTPYLDYQFIKAVLSSKYAGANNDFFTKNPFKRMKGQYIYADIIKKTNATILYQKTGKGYRPADVRFFWNRYRILFPFIQKRWKRKRTKTYMDNLGIISGVLRNRDELLEILNQQEGLFHKQCLEDSLQDLTAYVNEKDRDTLLMSIAILYNIGLCQTNEKIENRELVNSIDRL